MKTLPLVKQLQAQGIDIEYRVRSDGGIIVTRVRQNKFKGAEGNKFIRALANAPLSEAQIKQRQKIKPKKGMSPQKRKLAPVPDDVRKEIRRLQSVYRKDKKKGKPTVPNFREHMKKFGEARAREMLKESDYYVRGIAYTGNIEALINRLDTLATNISILGGNSDPIRELEVATEEYLKLYREKFTFDKLAWLFDIVYKFEKAYNANISESSSFKESLISEFVSNYMITLKS